jgi:hypothetical protein
VIIKEENDDSYDILPKDQDLSLEKKEQLANYEDDPERM